MKRFHDGGWSYDTITRAVYTAADREHRRARRFNEFSGILQGRPSQLLRGF